MMGLAADTKTEIRFEDFVECVCQQPVVEMDSHWRIQYFHTYQDKITYDYIGRVEEMEAGIAHVSKATYLDHRLFVRFAPHAQKAREKIGRFLDARSETKDCGQIRFGLPSFWLSHVGRALLAEPALDRCRQNVS